MVYCVVSFPKEKQVDAVPQSWFRADTGRCFYPPPNVTDITSLVQNQIPPDPTWKSYKAVLLRTYKTFAKASMKADKAKYTVRLDSTDVASGSSEGEEDGGVVTLPLVPFALGGGGRQKKSSEHRIAKRPKKATAVSENCNCNKAFQEEVLKKLAKLESQNQDLHDKVLHRGTMRLTAGNLSGSSLNMDIFLKRHLFSSDEEIPPFETKLKHVDFNSKVIDELTRIGGMGKSDTIHRMMEKVMHPSVGVLYSWHGMKQKKKFANLELAAVLKRALLKNPLQFTEKEVENGIQNWLRRSQERLSRAGGGNRAQDVIVEPRDEMDREEITNESS